jgi:hypothetical protein
VVDVSDEIRIGFVLDDELSEWLIELSHFYEKTPFDLITASITSLYNATFEEGVEK